jgi:hypothetical protein
MSWWRPDFAHDHNAAWWRTSAYDHIVAECFVSVAAAHHRNKQTETDAMVLMSLVRHSNQGVLNWLLSTFVLSFVA